MVELRHIWTMAIVSLVFICCWTSPASAERFAAWDSSNLYLDNGHIRRVISAGDKGDSFITTSLKMNNGGDEYVSGGSLEFYFELDGKGLSGRKDWKLEGRQAVTESHQGEGVTVVLSGAGEANQNVKIVLTYLLYPGLPVIRKKIAVINTGNIDRCLETVDVEHISLAWDDINAWVMADYGRQKRLGPFNGDMHDPLVIVHDLDGRRGVALGNEAPGVIKRTTVFTQAREATVGLTRPDHKNPFRKWLKPNEKWESPWVFIALYGQTDDPWRVLNGPVNDFVRRHMGIRLAEIEEKPVFVYNTWNPFRKEVSGSLVRDLARAAAECGVEEFVIDDGWQTNRGDWEIDYGKFPGGLKPVFDYIKSTGMKPGLWISLASAETKSKVFKEHPEWFIRNRLDQPANIHSENELARQTEVSACLSTGWYDHIKNVILNLVNEHGLAYVKLDLAIVASAYVKDETNTGCYAENHPLHRDRQESFLVTYRRCMDLFDELHREAPELFIDCTFETWGALQLIDYALVKHAEGDWLSNIEQKSHLGSLRARNLAWWRSPAIPAAALVIGNLVLDEPEHELHMLSLAGSLPIMLGDPRKLSAAERQSLKIRADWLRQMQGKHNYMLYRQDLAGFGEPLEGQWDGWARINTDSGSGGIVGVFRQGAVQDTRVVTLDGLKPNKRYAVRSAPGGREMYRLSGHELAGSGFQVVIDKLYGGALFEIELVD